MSNVSTTIIVGEWVLRPHNETIHLTVGSATAWWLTDEQARDLAQALQIWLERNAKVENETLL